MFRADVEAIAARFGLDPARLAQLIRGGDALVALRGSPAERSGGLLAAARDRAEDDCQPDREPADPASSDRSPDEACE
jgi:hypothetical protein